MAIEPVTNTQGEIVGYRENNGPIYRTLEEAESKSLSCPEATQDLELNLQNRQIAINEYNYGPLDPSQPNTEFWEEIAEIWDADDIEKVKSARCKNCAAFNVSYKIKQCIAQGIGSEPQADPFDSIDAGELGYCQFLKFKCAGERVCSAWVSGGPIR